MPQPSRMQTIAVITRVKNSVIAFTSNRLAGMMPPRNTETSAAAPVMIVDSLKPTPVNVTIPMIMPTQAAAAPTLIAYLAPTTKASRISMKRALPPSSLSTDHADTASDAPMMGSRPSPSVKIGSRMQSAIAATNATATKGLRLVSPSTMQPVMPQNAARYGVKSENSTI